MFRARCAPDPPTTPEPRSTATRRHTHTHTHTRAAALFWRRAARGAGLAARAAAGSCISRSRTPSALLLLLLPYQEPERRVLRDNSGTAGPRAAASSWAACAGAWEFWRGKVCAARPAQPAHWSRGLPLTASVSCQTNTLVRELSA